MLDIPSKVKARARSSNDHHKDKGGGLRIFKRQSHVDDFMARI